MAAQYELLKELLNSGTKLNFGQEFFSCGPMWYLLALLMGWILLDVILNIFPERYIPWAVGGAALLGWGASLV